jgi:ferrochelatase
LISGRRAKFAQANYDLMGGASPLLPETVAQAQALEQQLATHRPDDESRVFIAMRYWKPFAEETAREVAAFGPDEIVLLPLYPQYSTTTTGSSLAAWRSAYKGPGRSRAVCCYPIADGLAGATVDAIREVWTSAGAPEGVRLLFSAHGLPQKIVDAGDPYQAQIEATAAQVAAQLPEFPDWRVCFQSRVGPMKWLAPSTDAEIRAAGAEGKGVLISPIAFVSEHVETLVELDHEYAQLAQSVGCEPYLRAPTPSVRPGFIAELTAAVQGALGRSKGAAPNGAWACPASFSKCAARTKGMLA